MSKKLSYSLFLILTSAWWAWTFFVDFFVVGTVFKIVDNFWQAGELGMTVFGKLNTLEVIVSSLLVAILALQVRKQKAALPLLVISALSWMIAMTYFSYLTPKIMELTGLWRTADMIGLTAIKGIPDIQQEHQFYHNLYIGIDSVKLFILTVLIGLGIWKQEKMF